MATLIINENKDVLEYSEMSGQMNFRVNTEVYEKVLEFRDKTGFNLLYYVSDSIMPEIVIGVEKHENCIIFDTNDYTTSFVIEGNNKEFFNLSQKGKIRKYKIEDLLGD